MGTYDVVTNLFGLVMVKTGLLEKGGEKRATEKLEGEIVIKSSCIDENGDYFTWEIGLSSNLADASAFEDDGEDWHDAKGEMASHEDVFNLVSE